MLVVPLLVWQRWIVACRLSIAAAAAADADHCSYSLGQLLLHLTALCKRVVGVWMNDAALLHGTPPALTGVAASVLLALLLLASSLV